MESDTILNLEKNALWSDISGLKSAMQKSKNQNHWIFKSNQILLTMQSGDFLF